MTLPVVCTVAGSDSSGGAGIQADLLTFAACGVYGATCITALTAQNTVGVRCAQSISRRMVVAQMDAVWDDLHPAAWKTGMLAGGGVIDGVVDRLERYGRPPLVVDPVMVATSGARLLAEEAVAAVRDRLLPLALMVTPNLREVAELTGMTPWHAEEAIPAARRLGALGPRWVVIKGGHAPGDEVVDLLWDVEQERPHWLRYPRIDTTSTHGTGCTLSAGIAAFLALGLPVQEATLRARGYVQRALQRAPGLGAGHGPLGHMAARP